ncbi:MAG: hypothetical protein WDZ59_09740 [Pirellulales bacterium]
MNERALFNVISKVVGFLMLLSGLSSLLWAFLASRYEQQYNMPFDPGEGLSWFTGGASTLVGAFLCLKSSALTRWLYRIDPPLEDEPEPPETS